VPGISLDSLGQSLLSAALGFLGSVALFRTELTLLKRELADLRLKSDRSDKRQLAQMQVLIAVARKMEVDDNLTDFLAAFVGGS
jgi:hypothetical protein